MTLTIAILWYEFNYQHTNSKITIKWKQYN